MHLSLLPRSLSSGPEAKDGGVRVHPSKLIRSFTLAHHTYSPTTHHHLPPICERWRETMGEQTPGALAQACSRAWGKVALGKPGHLPEN